MTLTDYFNDNNLNTIKVGDETITISDELQTKLTTVNIVRGTTDGDVLDIEPQGITGPLSMSYTPIAGNDSNVVGANSGADISVYGKYNVVSGGEGENYINLYDGAENNTVLGGAGYNYINLYNGAKNNVVSGGAGYDSIYLYEGSENNTIICGAGDDSIYLYEGSHNNTIEFSTGDGSDYISANSTSTSDGNGSDSILYFKDKSIDELTFSKSDWSSDLIITYGNSTDKVTLSYWLNPDDKDENINTIKDKNGNIYSITEIMPVMGTPTANQDYIYVGGNQIVDSLEGDDYLYIYGSGNTVSGGAGNDYIFLLEGNHNNTLKFSTGDGGNTVCSFYDPTGYGYKLNGSDSTLYFKDKTIDELTFSIDYNELIITYGDSTDTVTLYGWVNSDEDKRIDTIKDKNNNTYSISDKFIEMGIYGTPTTNSDYLYIYGSGNIVSGDEGSDDIRLYRGAENNTISGGAGGDSIYLYDGSHNNTIEFSTGDGSDNIHSGYEGNYTDPCNGSDSVLYFKDKTIDELTFTKSNTNLIITYGNSSDKVTLYYWFTSGYEDKRINTIKDKDEHICSISDKINEIITATGMLGTSSTGKDYLYIYGDNKTVDSLAESDQLNVYGSNNTISGGAGYDTIYLNEGAENNTVSGGAGIDSIYLCKGAKNNTVSGGADGDSIYLYEGSHSTLEYSTYDGADRIYSGYNGSTVSYNGADSTL